jgi:dihydrodipicolinate synthase/N-acetylneuraminate lyase
MSPRWEGLFCALWMPTDENGRLLNNALEQNLEYLKSRGVQGLLALGSTGEFLRLDPAERRRAMEQVARFAQPLRLMFNISELRPAAVAELGRCARDLGAEAVSLLPPYFFPLAQEDLVEFFVRGAEAAKLPLFLYNFPERTGNRIALETIAAVAERVPVAGVKQSGAEFTYHGPLVELGRQKGFVVMTGADTRLPEAVAMGVTGCVSGLSNAVPELVSQSLIQALQGQVPGPGSPADHLRELSLRLPAVAFPLDVAGCMEARGLPVGAPKIALSAATRARYETFVRDLRTLFREWNLD